jgi:hypothetical protein
MTILNKNRPAKRYLIRLLRVSVITAAFAAILVTMGHEATAFVPVCDCNNSAQCGAGALCAVDCKGTLRGVCSVP